MQSVSDKMSYLKGLYISIISLNEIRFFTVNLKSLVNPKMLLPYFSR